MARKKIEPITGIGRDPENKLIVQKARPLFDLWRSELSLSEFKILDAYLARINTHKPEERVVVFTKGELEELLGVKKINIDDLKARVIRLMKPIILQHDQKGFKGLPLFEEADCRQDEETGLWTVKLECTRKAMKYFFNIEELGYLRYKLRSITGLTSRYTYILFTYLEANRFRKIWEVSLDELKEILNCENDELYKEYKFFNQRILKRCQKELHEKTECRFSYQTISTGRKVTAIRFALETLPAIEVPEADPNQLTLFGDGGPDDQIGFLMDACPGFSRADMEQIWEVLVLVDDSKLPTNVPTGGIEFRRYHYLSERFAAMKRADTKRPIKNRFAYFLKLVKVDAGLE